MRLFSRLRNKKEIAKTVIERERYYDEYVRKITPTLIKEYPDHIIIDNEVYATCIFVGVPPSQTGRGFPRNLAPDFTDQIMAVEATRDYLIGISYSCSPIAHEEAQKLVDDALFNNKISRSEIDRKTMKESGTSAHSLRYDLEGNDYVDIYHTIYNNDARMFDCQYIITLWSSSVKGLENGISKIKGVMDANIVKMEVPYYTILETFMAAQPFPIAIESAEIQQLSHDCATLIPLRDPLTPLSDTGLIYGERKIDNAPFIVNFNDLAAGHHLVIGSTRSGKTVFLMKMLMALYGMLNHRVVYITPKPDNRTDYLAVAEYYKDQAGVLNIGNRKGQNNINPLQVILDHNAAYLSDDDYVNQFNNHLDLVMAFFRVLDTSKLMDNYVHESLIEIYRRNGIIRKDPPTWKDLPGDKWPVLLDLRELWKEDANNVSAIAMLGRTTWLETTCEYINRPTDVIFDKPITIIDLSGVPLPLRDAMNAFVVGMIGMLFNSELDRKTVVMIDEGRVFLNDKNLAELILRMYTQGGSAGLYAWFTTQQPSDAKDDDVKELLKNNSFANFIMGNVQPQSYDMLQSFFNLSDEDVAALRGCGIGQGLAQVNNTVTAVDFKLTDLESRVILGTEKPGSKPGLNSGFEMVDNRLKYLAEENHAYIEEWVKGDSKVLAPGRDRHPIQRAFKSGTTGIWIESSKVKNGKILNQTIDHYGMVLQMAAYLLHNGFSVEVNHHDDADIVATIDGQTIAIEYERPRSHTTDELIGKNQRWQTKYGRVVFVVTSANYKQVSADNCIGPTKTVKRGAMLHEFIENYIYEINHQTT